MAERTELGKIQEVAFGYGGYQEAQIGISFTLGGAGWGVTDFWGYWSGARSDHTKWTEEARVKSLGETVMRINALLREAKRESIDRLKDVPIEITFDGNVLKSWRVLKEVL